MATVEPKALYKVSPAEPQMGYFTVSIDCTKFTDTETVNGGRVSPCVATENIKYKRFWCRKPSNFKMLSVADI